MYVYTRESGNEREVMGEKGQRERERQTDRQTDRQTYRHERERERDRQTDRQTESIILLWYSTRSWVCLGRR